MDQTIASFNTNTLKIMGAVNSTDYTVLQSVGYTSNNPVPF